MAIDSINRPILLISNWSTEKLVKSVKEKLSSVLNRNPVEYLHIPQNYFTDKSPKVRIEKSVRGKHVYIFSDVNNKIDDWSINDKYMFARWITRAVRHGKPKTINKAFTTRPYARDDRTEERKWDDNGTVKMSQLATEVRDDFENYWCDYMITMDIHNPDSVKDAKNKMNIVDLPVGRLFNEVIEKEKLDTDNLVYLSTDSSGSKKIKPIAEDHNVNTYPVEKYRKSWQWQKVEKTVVFCDEEDIKDKTVILYDDMVDTAGSIEKVLNEILKKKPKEIILLISHPFLNKDAISIIENLQERGIIKCMYTTNSIEHPHLPKCIKIIDIWNIITHTIESIVKETQILHNNNTPIVVDSSNK